MKGIKTMNKLTQKNILIILESTMLVLLVINALIFTIMFVFTSFKTPPRFTDELNNEICIQELI